MPNESEDTNIVEVQKESQGAIEFTQAKEREMYIGSRRSCAQRSHIIPLQGFNA